jgi:hypothetical protein
VTKRGGDNSYNMMIDIAGEAFDEMVKRYTEMLEDARGGPRLTRRQKLQEYQEFLALPSELQNVVIGELEAGGVDSEKWIIERQRMMEAEHG